MNKNRKGFTLVELIVVVTIFGVILGAILNMIKPANNVYHDADATMESNIIGSGLIDYLDDELRYSTNVLAKALLSTFSFVSVFIRTERRHSTSEFDFVQAY